eukprot:CAMPEP_0201526934 /NCGR_PEP_ID=MMETSP0161_2-20130828/33445_1 /ASSEMBLY_ACC=CAM_ASM_000251 /TAXON_ID=180227 /ORGANISM="Neoparamoeba aestuarina, Strain SoJaBio B1-5/56/2" /LENGTH=306 /DNA_ID=CAMNT_0047927541 /DNA_START=57 /DNA_END=973 /DNA_ORIENTATION=-
MTQSDAAKPWTRNLFSQFSKYRSVYKTSFETGPGDFESVDIMVRLSQRDRTCEKLFESKTLNGLSSQPARSPNAMRSEASTAQCSAHPTYNENETLLLLADSTGKEHYMNRLLEKFDKVEGNMTKYSQVLQQPSEYSLDELHKFSNSEDNNTFLEYVSQQHSKGEVVAKEAMKIMQHMFRKLHKAAAGSSSNRRILSSIRQKWASYTLHFHEIESRFKESISEMISDNSKLEEKLILDKPRGCFTPLTTSQAKLHRLYEQAKETENQILELHRDLNELNSSYQEFRCLVLDQGSMIDDIRYNLASG